jgi:acyl homoserine lactone synthase
MHWDVNVVDGWEIDAFDDLNPLYLLSLDENEQVRGSLRLLPTTGPHMLADVFSTLLPDGEPIRSATIWESSRFSVDLDAPSVRAENGVNHVTAELILGITEVGLAAGLTHVVSAYDLVMERVLKRAQCHAERLGEPQRVGRVKAVAGLFDVSNAMLKRVRAASEITGSVLEVQSAGAIGLVA